MPPEQSVDPIEAMVDQWLGEEGQNDEQSTTTQEGGDTDGSTTTEPAQGQTEQTQSTEPTQQEVKPTGQSGKPSDQQQRTTEQAPRPNPGDLVGRDGNVIARAGAERRFYETAQRATQQAQQYKQQLDTTTAQLTAFREAAQLPTQLGLSPEESSTGLQLVASWKQNPVGVIQYLVEQAKAAGHNVEGLGGISDMGAIRRMIDERLAPVTQQAQSVQAQEQAQTAAREQVQALASAYGESALVNSDALSKLIGASQESGQSMSLEQAYFRFAEWCYRNQYDPHQPIDAQIEARRAPQANTPAQSEQRNPPRPNGRAVSAPNGVTPVDPTAVFTGQESMRDIVRASLREAGFNA